jgi:ribonuclease HII
MVREAARLESLFTVEAEYRMLGYQRIAGVDEVGVAPLAGPVVAAAVMLPFPFHLPELNDSKQLTAEQREVMYDAIVHEALAISIGEASVEEIDQLNILQATRLAHKRAIEGLNQRPDLVLIDGRFAAAVPIPQLVVVDGDARCAVIAAASIVAKVTRDRLMTQLDDQYPQYGFARHKGYGTRAHVKAIRQFGITCLHRRSFARLRSVQELLAIESP